MGRVLLGVSGSIAAYKAVSVARELMRAGHEVQAVLTRGGQQFVTPLTFSALTGRQALSDHALGEDGEIQHVERAYDVDLVLVAPATANLLARMAHGMADDVLTALILSTPAPVMVAPAMESGMWEHQATQYNLRMLKDRGVHILQPGSGALASGRQGKGRMQEPDAIVAAAQLLLDGGPWRGRSVLVTAGPTWESLDPVRVLSNRSTGRMGIEIADAARRRGADVTLVLGPTHLRPESSAVTVVPVESASEMLQACQAVGAVDVFVASAAVSDFAVKDPQGRKLKRNDPAAKTLQLSENPDVLATISQSLGSSQCTVVGFAAETENIEANARGKLEKKGCDLVIANRVGRTVGFGAHQTEVMAVSADSSVSFGPADKRAVAEFVLDQVDQAREQT